MFKLRKRVAVSFSGCGFLVPFHLGAAAAFAARDVRIEHALGSSAGAVVAASVILDVPVPECRRRLHHFVAHARKYLPLGAFHPEFHVATLFRRHLTSLVPDDAHLACSGRLTVSITDTGWRNKLVSQFHSRQDLIDCVVCSCFLPAFSGYYAPTFRGKVALT